MPPKKKMRTEDTHLFWTDDEVQLLLETTRDSKAKKAYTGLDWESIKDKYENICKTFVSNLRKQTDSEECAQSTDFFTKEWIASKIKQIPAKYRKALDAGRQSGRGRIVATFYDYYSEIWNGSSVTKSIQAGLETVVSLKTPADEDIDLLERASKENNDVELGEEEVFGDEAITVVSATSGITCSATSNVTPIQQNLRLTSTPIQPSSNESSNKRSIGQTSREKMEEMLENRRNKRVQRKLPKTQTSTNSEEEKFQRNLLERMERQDNLFRESMQSLQENVRTLTETMTQAFLMMRQIRNQGVPRNPPPSYYQPSNFGSPITSSFSCESNSQRNPNLGGIIKYL